MLFRSCSSADGNFSSSNGGDILRDEPIGTVLQSFSHGTRLDYSVIFGCLALLEVVGDGGTELRASEPPFVPFVPVLLQRDDFTDELFSLTVRVFVLRTPYFLSLFIVFVSDVVTSLVASPYSL